MSILSEVSRVSYSEGDPVHSVDVTFSPISVAIETPLIPIAFTLFSLTKRITEIEDSPLLLVVAGTLQNLFLAVFGYPDLSVLPFNVGVALVLLWGIGKSYQLAQPILNKSPKEGAMDHSLVPLNFDQNRIDQLSDPIQQKRRFWHILIDCFPKRYDLNRTLQKETIPRLQRDVETLTQQVEQIEQFVKARPDLISTCEQYWKDFDQYSVKPSFICEILDLSKPVDQAYILGKEIREKKRILANYRYFFETYPQVEAALLKHMQEARDNHE